MRIAVDLRALQLGSEYRGIGAYLVNLLRRFPIVDGDHEWVFVRYEGGDPAALVGAHLAGCEEIVVPKPPLDSKVAVLRSHVRDALGPGFGDLEQRGIDVFWQPDFLNGTPRLSGTRVVVTMYDLIPLIMQDAYLPRAAARLQRAEGWRDKLGHLIAGGTWRRRYMRCLSELPRADRILSISEHTTADLAERLSIGVDRVATIPLGGPEPLDDELRAADAVPDVAGRDFLLFIGGLDQRRRVDDLITAFDRLRARGNDLDLVLVGRDFEAMHPVHHSSTTKALASSPHTSHIHVLGYVEEGVKHWLYANAFAFVFPSLYEGFGLPLLEAMVNRCPVISYRNSSLVEVGGDAAILLDPGGADQMVGAVESLLSAPERRAALVAAGVDRAALYSWDRCAEQTLSELERLGSR